MLVLQRMPWFASECLGKLRNAAHGIPKTGRIGAQKRGLYGFNRVQKRGLIGPKIQQKDSAICYNFLFVQYIFKVLCGFRLFQNG